GRRARPGGAEGARAARLRARPKRRLAVGGDREGTGVVAERPGRGGDPCPDERSTSPDHEERWTPVVQRSLPTQSRSPVSTGWAGPCGERRCSDGLWRFSPPPSSAPRFWSPAAWVFRPKRSSLKARAASSRSTCPAA